MWASGIFYTQHSNIYEEGFPFCLVKKFQVMLSPDFVQVIMAVLQVFGSNFGTKRQTPMAILKLQEHNIFFKLSQYNIEMLYILTFQVLSILGGQISCFV